MQRVVVEDRACRTCSCGDGDGAAASAEVHVHGGVAVFAVTSTGWDDRTARAVAPLTVGVHAPAVHRAVVQYRAHVVGGPIDGDCSPANGEVDLDGAVGYRSVNRGYSVALSPAVYRVVLEDGAGAVSRCGYCDCSHAC